MAHNRNNIRPKKIKPFKFLLQESGDLLLELRKEVTSGEKILDPNTQKKRELVVRLDNIMNQLHEQWEFVCQEERDIQKTPQFTFFSESPEELEERRVRVKKAKRKLQLTMKHLSEIIRGITDLTISKENTTKEQIDQFNEETIDLNKQMSDLLKLYTKLKKSNLNINRLEYGKDLSTYLSYITAASKAAVTVWLAWMQTLSEATQTAGAIFYPISATFTTLTKLFIFLGRTTQFFIARSEAQKQEADDLRKLELANTKELLKKSAALKLLSVALSTLSIIAFAGVLTTTLGFIFVAAATWVDWVDDGLLAARRANQSLKEFKTQHTEIFNDPETTKELKEKLKSLEENAEKAKTRAQWGFANAIAMTLMACAPIPVAGVFIGGVGLAIFAVVTTRNIYVAGKEYLDSRNRKKHHKYQEIAEEGPDNVNVIEVELQSAPQHKTSLEETSTTTFTKLFRSQSKNDNVMPPNIKSAKGKTQSGSETESSHTAKKIQ